MALTLMLSFTVSANTLGEPHIVGVTVNDTEVGAVAAYREKGRFWLPLGEIVHALGFEHGTDSVTVVRSVTTEGECGDPQLLRPALVDILLAPEGGRQRQIEIEGC